MKNAHRKIDRNRIADQISRKRKMRKLSQSELAELVGIHSSYISKIEYGQSCSTETLLKICNVLGLRIGSVLGV